MLRTPRREPLIADHSAVAQLIAVGALLALTALLLIVRRRIAIATASGADLGRGILGQAAGGAGGAGAELAAAPISAFDAQHSEVVDRDPGRNLIVAADTSSSRSSLPPIVDIGGHTAPLTATSQPVGVDNITVTVPEQLTEGSVKVTVIRADGVRATGPGGTDGLTLTITMPPQ